MNPESTRTQRRLQATVAGHLEACHQADAAKTWDRLTEAGVLDAAMPVAAGGLGLGQRDLCLVQEELGAQLADDTFARGVLAALDLLELAEWSTTKHIFAASPAIDASAVLAPTPDSASPTDPRAALVLQLDEGSSLLQVVAPPASVILELAADPGSLERARRRDRIRGAGWAVGVARRALQLGVARARDRRVGTRPLIEHQASGHRIARTAVAVTAARLEVWDAAWHEDELGDSGHRADTCLATALTTALDATRATAQLFGAAGTSEVHAVAVTMAAQRAAIARGPISALWDRAAEHRYPWLRDDARASAGAATIEGPASA